MKKIFIASALSVATLLSFSAQSYAATTMTTTTIQQVDHRPIHQVRHMRHHQRCYVKTVKYRNHGRIVVKKTRVCR